MMQREAAPAASFDASLLMPSSPSSAHPVLVSARRRRGRRVLILVVVAASLLVGAVAPAGALLTGVDVASYQHPNGAPINWGQVRAAGHSYAFVKATEGTGYTNPWFRQDFDGAGAAGLYRGAYHYARPGLPLSTATAEARYMVSVTGTLGGGADLPLVLDLEETGGLGPTDLAAWARTFLGELERLTGRPPIIYVGYYFWRDAVGAPSDLASRYRLWLPSYPADPNSTTFRPLVPAGWSTWTFWQYTSTGSVPGIVGNVDVNRFCCDAGTLAGLAGSAEGAGNPFGNLDIVNRLPGSAQIEGWAIDPDTRQPVTAHLYVDGRWAAQVVADAPRADVGAAYPGYGPLHGLSTRIPIGPGSREICAYAINTGPGSTNPLLGCRSLVADPIGNLDGLEITADGDVVATGWALDADAAVPIGVHFYVDGRWGGALTTDTARPDVQATYPGAGATQGFRTTFRGLIGRHTVCAYGINIGSGTTNPLLGCATVDVPSGDPVGALTGVATGLGSARVTGWAMDPDAVGPIDVHLYVDGAWGGSHLAALPSTDAVLALGGPVATGFDVTLALEWRAPHGVRLRHQRGSRDHQSPPRLSDLRHRDRPGRDTRRGGPVGQHRQPRGMGDRPGHDRADRGARVRGRSVGGTHHCRPVPPRRRRRLPALRPRPRVLDRDRCAVRPPSGLRVPHQPGPGHDESPPGVSPGLTAIVERPPPFW